NKSKPVSTNDTENALFYQLFDRSRFWTPSGEQLLKKTLKSQHAEDGNILCFGNVGTKDFSVLISKATNTKKFDVLVSEWYNGDIPYTWLKPYNYISDYFISVLVVEGKHDTVNRDTINDKIAKGELNVIGNWTGTIIPDFKDGMGVNHYIQDIINSSTSLTHVLCSVNTDALEFNEETVIDFNGESLIGITDSTDVKFLSYEYTISNANLFTTALTTLTPSGSFYAKYGRDAFALSEEDSKQLSIGDFIASTDVATSEKHLVRVVSKVYDTDNQSYVYNTVIPVSINDNTVTKQISATDPSLNNLYKFKFHQGLKLKKHHLPGFDGKFNTAQPSVEGGVEKIYKMLTDQGINRGLTNPDMIPYRYIVDTMGFGLQPMLGGKRYLSLLAKQRGKCTAIINAPSMTHLANAQDPYFCDTFNTGSSETPIFNTKWIPEGGNPNMQRSFRFSLPDEDNGAKYCGVFGPYLKYNDNGKTILVPPAADVSNAFLRKYLGGNPYAIVANRNGLLSNPNIVGVEYMIDNKDRDYLEGFGYNSIIERPSRGEVMIYSNATPFQSVNSDFNYLHVREILNTIELESEEILQSFVFDGNDDLNRLTAINSITPFLQAMQDSGALYKYEVSINTDGNVIDAGFAVVDIAVWITKGMEKIVQRISVNRLGTTANGGSLIV
ncbi:MAG: phage tail sheath C-terminal domain-containing protein, partial [Bacteroidales bacterium]